jgi:hypothetical protein
MMEEQDAEEWKGEESVDKLEIFLSQYTQIVTNIGQANSTERTGTEASAPEGKLIWPAL